MSNFWVDLPSPFSILAPMDDVTDDVFRRVILKAARPSVFFTEFTNSDGLVHGGHGIPLRKLKFTHDQHPIVAQIWGNNAESMEKATVIVKNLGFDGIDINMGCPVDDVVKKGAGAGLIGKYKEAKEIIDAVKSGAGGMPVSVKTRLGIKENTAKEWATFLLGNNIAALTIHGRTAKEMSKVPASWDEIGKVVKIKNEISPKTLVIGNGDIKSYEEIKEMNKKHGVDGVMVGRGVFENPWVFDTTMKVHTKAEHFELMNYHIDLFEETWGKTKNFSILKKFFKMYVKGFDGASEFRQKLVEAKSIEEVRSILQKNRATSTDD